MPQVRRLLLVTLLGFFSFCLTLASLPFWAVSGGTSPSTAGLVTTTMLASTVATQAAVPWLLIRFDTGVVLAAGLVALGAPAPFLALSAQLEPLLVTAAIRGAGFAILTVVGTSLTATVAPAGRHGESVGLYGLGIALPNLLGVPVGVVLTQHGEFLWVALLAASPLAAVPVALGLGKEPVLRSGKTVVRSHRRAVVAVLAPSFVLLAVTVAGGGLLTYVPIARPDGALAAAALLLFGLVAAASRWRVGAIADRGGTRFLLPGFVLVAVVGMVLVALGVHATSDAAVLAGAVVFGAGYGAVQNLTLVVAFARVGPSRTTTASSVWNAAFDTGTGIGAGVTGAVAAMGIGLGGAFVLSAALMTVALPLSFAGARNQSPEASAQDTASTG